MFSFDRHSTARVTLASAFIASLVFESVRADVTTNTGAAYAQECSNKGVPLPPNWGGANWTYNGSMGPGSNPLKENFIIRGRPAHVYFAQSALGVCMALPRPNLPSATPGPNTVPGAAFGVICQG